VLDEEHMKARDPRKSVTQKGVEHLMRRFLGKD
jgi:hypothetical protein